MPSKIYKTTSLTLLFLACMLLVSPAPALAKRAGPEAFECFRFDIDTSTPVKDLLPIPPSQTRLRAELIEDLARVPLVDFQQVPAVQLGNDNEAKDRATRDARIRLAQQMAKINFLNGQKTDRFLELLLANRPDLAGLPFSMGDACRQKGAERREFKDAVAAVRSCLGRKRAVDDTSSDHAEIFWTAYKGRHQFKPQEERSAVAGLMQILGPEAAEFQQGLVVRLAEFEKSEESKKDATLALARLAVFSTDSGTRQNALAVLQKRDCSATDVLLLRGLRYPLPSVARNAAEAIVLLKRSELIPDLIKLLEEPDPRAPVVREVEGKKVAEVRELVRINHHRNCLLCHPPGNTSDVIRKVQEVGKEEPVAGHPGVRSVSLFVQSIDNDVEIAAVPLPTEPLGTMANGYRRFSSPDVLVRADVTYLRQDFSLLQKVADAQPWPEMQRFDYLVRSRALSEKETQEFQALFAKGDTALPYREAAADALRRLTGRDVSPSTSAAEWRKALGL